MEYEGWTVETRHPYDEADPAYCATCHGMIQPAIDFATGWGSIAHGATITDEAGVEHEVVVRKVIEEP